ncbi:MAG: hypothetical protein JW860_04165, partial [Sedimentisphaerales bacterium]|nr:hypothetical protein [Sedimentisphaerales bacterium]
MNDYVFPEKTSLINQNGPMIGILSNFHPFVNGYLQANFWYYLRRGYQMSGGNNRCHKKDATVKNGYWQLKPLFLIQKQ